MSDWRKGLDKQLDAAVDPIRPVLESALEATAGIVYEAGGREEREAASNFLHLNIERHPGAITRDDLYAWLEQIEDGEHRKEDV